MKIHQFLQPKNISDIYGQPRVRKIVKEILSGYYRPKALLFDGPPGVGKTATSSVLYYGLNCENFDKNLYKVCGKCKSCSYHKYAKEVFRAQLFSLTEKRILGAKLIVNLAPNYKVRIVSFEEVSNWSYKDQDKFLTIIDDSGEATLIILNSTLDRNNENMDKERFLEAFENRCVRVSFDYLGEQSLTKLVRSLARRSGVNLDSNQINEIVTSADGSGRMTVELFIRKISTNGELRSQWLEKNEGF